MISLANLFSILTFLVAFAELTLHIMESANAAESNNHLTLAIHLTIIVVKGGE